MKKWKDHLPGLVYLITLLILTGAELIVSIIYKRWIFFGFSVGILVIIAIDSYSHWRYIMLPLTTQLKSLEEGAKKFEIEWTNDTLSNLAENIEKIFSSFRNLQIENKTLNKSLEKERCYYQNILEYIQPGLLFIDNHGLILWQIGKDITRFFGEIGKQRQNIKEVLLGCCDQQKKGEIKL